MAHIQSIIKTIIPILFGTAIYAFGLHYFVIPNEIMEGGVTGIALLLKYIFGLQPSISTLLLNVPLFFVGWRFLGRTPMLYTMVGTLSVSFFLWIMEELIHTGWLVPFKTENDLFLVAAYTGVTLGTGLGIVFRYGGTTGGADILARIAHKWKGWSIGRTILMIDVVVIGLSVFFLPVEKILYTFVAVFIASKLIDVMIEGSYATQAFTIISNRSEEVAAVITRELDRGATIFPAFGAYSNQPKNVIYCVVSRTEMKRLKDLVHSIDPLAFLIITKVHDVVGEGFKPNG
ncbi:MULTISPECIES: YitT family protein [Paenibacillus]|uniref:YitT family protein n=1 Tax=Paenibacillus TaxID=44249 RepID=UPI0022B88867|nr:YitT family protein [Paenibacillus caseinilyticus]MCZ8520509.1 YitT family protein [Paenibacillus caseinilyticus]